MFDFLTRLFDASDFAARRHEPGWTPGLVGLHVVADLLIGVACVAGPVVLVAYARRRRGLRLGRLVVLVAAFLALVGGAAFLDVLATDLPLYRLAGLVKLLAGLVALAAVAALVAVAPQAL